MFIISCIGVSKFLHVILNFSKFLCIISCTCISKLLCVLVTFKHFQAVRQLEWNYAKFKIRPNHMSKQVFCTTHIPSLPVLIAPLVSVQLKNEQASAQQSPFFSFCSSHVTETFPVEGHTLFVSYSIVRYTLVVNLSHGPTTHHPTCFPTGCHQLDLQATNNPPDPSQLRRNPYTYTL